MQMVRKHCMRDPNGRRVKKFGNHWSNKTNAAEFFQCKEIAG